MALRENEAYQEEFFSGQVLQVGRNSKVRLCLHLLHISLCIVNESLSRVLHEQNELVKEQLYLSVMIQDSVHGNLFSVGIAFSLEPLVTSCFKKLLLFCSFAWFLPFKVAFDFSKMSVPFVFLHYFSLISVEDDYNKKCLFVQMHVATSTSQSCCGVQMTLDWKLRLLMCAEKRFHTALCCHNQKFIRSGNILFLIFQIPSVTSDSCRFLTSQFYEAAFAISEHFEILYKMTAASVQEIIIIHKTTGPSLYITQLCFKGECV